MNFLIRFTTLILLLFSLTKVMAQTPPPPDVNSKGDVEAPYVGADIVEDSSEEVYTYVEEAPTFIKGTITEYITQNYLITEKMAAKGIAGMLWIYFIVEKDGSVSSVKVLKGLSANQDLEAIRVIKSSSGMWKPGKMNGEPVRTKMVQKFTFAEEDFE